MGLGTVAYNGKIYNLDYMSSDELHTLFCKIEEEKKEDFNKVKNILKDIKNNL